MTIQVAGGLNEGMDTGGVLTRTMIPSPAEVSYEADVEMESEGVVEGRESPAAPKGRPSGPKAAAKAERCEPVFSESSRSASKARHSSVSSRHDARMQSSGRSKSSRSSRRIVQDLNLWLRRVLLQSR
jgi:hypothetical protein